MVRLTTERREGPALGRCSGAWVNQVCPAKPKLTRFALPTPLDQNQVGQQGVGVVLEPFIGLAVVPASLRIGSKVDRGPAKSGSDLLAGVAGVGEVAIIGAIDVCRWNQGFGESRSRGEGRRPEWVLF